MLRILLLSVLCVFAFGKPIISVSIPPQAFFVEKIAKDSVEINILIPSNSDEHTMEFKPQALKKLEQSEIYFLADLELEKILEKKIQKLSLFVFSDTAPPIVVHFDGHFFFFFKY